MPYKHLSNAVCSLEPLRLWDFEWEEGDEFIVGLPHVPEWEDSEFEEAA